MLVPGMVSVAEAMAEGFTEEEVLDLGISGQVVFLVVVPEMGACRVPDVALSHFMAGEAAYTAQGMPLHWNAGALSGVWTIQRDRLRILRSSWDEYLLSLEALAAALDAAPEPQAEAPAVGMSGAPAWAVTRPQRYQGYASPLHRFLSAAHRDGKPRPSARDVIEEWRVRQPAEIAQVMPDGVNYYDSKGNTKAADLEAIRKSIDRMTSAR